jgi:hypothetical protein
MNLESAMFGTKAVMRDQKLIRSPGLLAPMFMTSTYCWDPETRDRYVSATREGIF